MEPSSLSQLSLPLHQSILSQMKQLLEEHTYILTASLIGLCSLGLLGLLGFRRWMVGAVCHSEARLDGKTVLITGANTGIGKETAVDLARRGARVVLACRDMDRAHSAAQEVRQRSGNGNVDVKHLDLASLRSIRDMAAQFLQEEERLDILINNAGVMMTPPWRTEDGFEMQFGVNHLGHFLLTNLLLDLLKSSAPSRIITVSSSAHESADKIHFDDINLERSYDPMKSYRRSKLANVLFTRQLAARLRGTGVSTYSLHPGVIRTELPRHALAALSPWKRWLVRPILMLIKSPSEGAQTTIYCAVEPSLERVSGLYYSDCAPKQPAPAALDEQVARRLWDLSASMVGLDQNNTEFSPPVSQVTSKTT